MCCWVNYIPDLEDFMIKKCKKSHLWYLTLITYYNYDILAILYCFSFSGLLYHKLSAQKLLPHISGVQKSEVRLLTRLVPFYRLTGGICPTSVPRLSPGFWWEKESGLLAVLSSLGFVEASSSVCLHLHIAFFLCPYRCSNFHNL